MAIMRIMTATVTVTVTVTGHEEIIFSNYSMHIDTQQAATKANNGTMGDAGLAGAGVGD